MKVTNTDQFVAVCTSLRENDPHVTELDLSGFIEFDHAKAFVLLGDLKGNTNLKTLQICKKNTYSYPLSIEALQKIFNFFLSSKTINNLILSPGQIAVSSQKHAMRLQEDFEDAYRTYISRRNDELKRTIVYEILAAYIERMDQQLSAQAYAQRQAKRGRVITFDYNQIRGRKFVPLDIICEFAGIEVSMPRKFFAPQ